MSMAKIRQQVEKHIVERVVMDALAAGYEISVHDGEETVVRRSTNPDQIIKAMFSTDEDYLYLYKPKQRGVEGWVHFVYGNSGHDVISDHLSSPEMDKLLAGANALADSYQ